MTGRREVRECMMAVNETSTLVHQLQRQFLSCGLCHERYTDPKVLPCLHSFCGHCLHAYIPAHSLSLACPSCRHQSILPRDGVSALQTNYVIGQLIDVIDASRYCGECLETASTGQCLLPCELALCAACAVEHVQRFTSHCVTTLLTPSDVEERQRRLLTRDSVTSPMVCANHESEALSFYCSDCDTAVCQVCATTGEHQTPHRTVPLRETVDVHRQALMELLNEAKERLPVS